MGQGSETIHIDPATSPRAPVAPIMTPATSPRPGGGIPYAVAASHLHTRITNLFQHSSLRFCFREQLAEVNIMQEKILQY